MVRASILLLLLSSSTLAQRVAYLIRFGGGADVDWSGSISPAPVRITPWQFDSRDEAFGDRWKCTTRREVYWDTPYESSMKGTSRRERLTLKGVVVEYSRAQAQAMRVTTAQGDFSFNGPGTFLDGRVSVSPAAPIDYLTRGPEAEDYPALYEARNGALWLAYQSYESAGDQVYVRRYAGGAWSSPEPLATPGGDVFRTSLSEDRNGHVWVIWSAQVGGNFDLYGRAWDGRKWRPVSRITTAPGSDIFHTAATDRAGSMHLAWMSARDGNFDIFTRSFDGGKWSPETKVSDSSANDWEPAIAAAPDGSIAFLWDTYDKGNYDIVLKTMRAGRLGPLTPIASSGAFESRVSAQYDARGALWMAWDEGDWNWGKDYGQGIIENGRGLFVRRQTRVARWSNGRLEEPAGAFTAALPEEFRQIMHQPRLVLDSGGRPWVFFRFRVNTPVAGGGRESRRTSYRQAVTWHDGRNWAPAIEFHDGFGRADSTSAALAARDGSIHAVWHTDGRLWPLSAETRQELVGAVLPPLASAAPPAMVPFAPSLENLPPSHPSEAADLARIRAYRVTLNGKQYRIVRGDIHRHTDISWDGNRDGSLHDSYRYALDAAGFEYQGVCDHQAGNEVPYSWWMIQKAVDLFSIAGRFAPLYSYERSLPYPNGHRNVLFAERGRPVLPIPQAEQQGREGAGRLYAYLRQYSGLTTSHTSATGAGTDWRDSSEDLEPVVEIYQGYRRNYEGPGTPRAPAQGEEPSRFAPGYVWNAWAKGIKMGVQSSSDHVSTHISYGAFYVESIDRHSILAAIRARRTYAATDNIILDFRAGTRFMGESFTAPEPPPLTANIVGTGALDKVVVVKDNRVVYAAPGAGATMSLSYTDREPGSGTHYYYVRVEQKDGQLAWSSPVWITYP